MRQAWLFAGTCQLWIWLNAATALAFRFWVVDRFNYTTFVEGKLWPSVFMLEGVVQLSVALAAWAMLKKTPRGRSWGDWAATVFNILVFGYIVAAWALVLQGQFRLAATFGLFGGYLTIPAILFALYCGLVRPRPISLWIYAVTVTVALKSCAIIPVRDPSRAFISYVAIILIALLSAAFPLRFGLARTGSSKEAAP
jgi:hypothetical protein